SDLKLSSKSEGAFSRTGARGRVRIPSLGSLAADCGPLVRAWDVRTAPADARFSPRHRFHRVSASLPAERHTRRGRGAHGDHRGCGGTWGNKKTIAFGRGRCASGRHTKGVT